ncbi:MAG: cupin domain-containing protein [Bacteroidales bacterium]|nr:cupin domain-containing protein [Bacteroidales bacterium]
MKKISYFILLAIFAIACNSPQTNDAPSGALEDQVEKQELVFKDFGGEPLVIDIEDYTLTNETFRTAIWTGEFMQLTIMSIPVGGEVGLEVHDDIEQFLRVEEGFAQVLMGDAEDNLDFVQNAEDDDVILVPAGKWHNIVNIGDFPLKLYSIYAVPEHEFGTVHLDKAESDADHEHHHHH